MRNTSSKSSNQVDFFHKKKNLKTLLGIHSDVLVWLKALSAQTARGAGVRNSIHYRDTHKKCNGYKPDLRTTFARCTLIKGRKESWDMIIKLSDLFFVIDIIKGHI